MIEVQRLPPAKPGDLPPAGIRVPRYFEAPIGIKPDAPPEPLPARYLHVALGDEPRALLERLLASGLYGGGSIHDLAERLLLAELRRHIDMPRLIERARR